MIMHFCIDGTYKGGQKLDCAECVRFDTSQKPIPAVTIAAAELERLQRIEAAAREYVKADTNEKDLAAFRKLAAALDGKPE